MEIKSEVIAENVLVEEVTVNKTDLANTLKGNSLDDVRKKFDVGAE